MLPGMSAMILGALPSGSLGATAFPSSVHKTGSTTGAPKLLTTPSVTATPSGGTGPYTYSWTRVSGSALISATSPASPTTAFSATLNPDDHETADFICTVTDANGATATASVSVSLTLVSLA